MEQGARLSPGSRNSGPFSDIQIAVRFAYEWHDDSGYWFRSYGNENWEFDAAGVVQRHFSCINYLPIADADRKYHWPVGRRPDDHPGLVRMAHGPEWI
jgi:nuclear transport factor 2 (NTF2) superfamily protein